MAVLDNSAIARDLEWVLGARLNRTAALRTKRKSIISHQDPGRGELEVSVAGVKRTCRSVHREEAAAGDREVQCIARGLKHPL